MTTTPAVSDAALLWVAVRNLSDHELDTIQATIKQFHCTGVGEAPINDQTTCLQLQLGDKMQSVRVDDFVHVFLDFVHRQVQIHADFYRYCGAATTAAASALRSNHMAPPPSATLETNRATFDSKAAFDDAYPPLASINAAVETRKRRITTTLLTSKGLTVAARPMPVDLAFPPLRASESTMRPIWGTKRSLLEHRMVHSSPRVSLSPERPKNIVHRSTPWGLPSEVGMATSETEMATVIAKEKKKNDKDIVGPKKKEASVNTIQPQQVQVKKQPVSSHARCLQQQRVVSSSWDNDESHVTVASAVVTTADCSVNKQAAKLYGFLIKGRFVEKTCAELQVLISLLYRADCTGCNHDNLPFETLNTNVSTSSLDVKASEFCWRTHCLDFAEIVFREIEPVLVHLGADLIALVQHSLRDADGRYSDTLERLDQVSRQREELRVAESARIGCQLPVEMMASAVQDFALPFNEETDSHLHYRTPAESLLYTNREKIRDGFLSLLRQFQQKQHSLIGIENAGVATVAIAAARELLAEVSLENRWWFAKFFVQELVQVGSNPFGESDKDLVLKIMENKLVVKNPDRLRKLHRRFSSQKPSTKSPQRHMQGSGSASSSGNNRASGKGSSTCQRKNRPDARSSSNEDDATKNFTATLERMKSFFTDNQLFFFHFLHSCDSYEFSELVKHQLERQFYVIGEARAASLDARKDFTEVVLRLKVVAKFLGYLRFSPQWQVTSSIRQLSAHNAAFKAVEREGIDTLEAARDSSLDVKKLLENSILRASISKCIPWLCDYLSMLAFDRLSSGTTYFKQLVALLQLLYRSPRLDYLGETGLYIAMQIERVFHVLHMGGCYIHSNGYRSQEFLPSSQVRKALACEHEFSPEGSKTGAGEDCLPFLYSQVFVQSCVSELDDLRGFIQTRAQPLPRRQFSIGSRTMATKQTGAPIRKLRPLQVVIEEDCCVDTISSFAVKPVDAVHATFPGVKAPATASLSNLLPLQEGDDILSDAVFKVHPKLKSAVQFVAETVTTDVCEYVIAHVVTPRADALVDRCASDSGLRSIGKSAPASAAFGADSAFAARASFQMLLTSKTRHEAQSTAMAALQIALCLGEERVNTAIPALMPPFSHPTLTNSIVFVALQRTMSALNTLVPKSSQTEFVKRIAFRNKSLLKEFGCASRVAAAALPASETLVHTSRGPTAAPSTVKSVEVQEKTQPPEQEKRYRQLRRHVAAVSTSANPHRPQKSSLAEWELNATLLSQSVSRFTTSLQECVVSGDLSRDPASPLHVSALGLWDIVWRGITPCVTFLRSSLNGCAASELLSMPKERVATVEQAIVGLAITFAVLLDVLVRCVKEMPGPNIAASRLQPILAFVVDSMMEVPRPSSIPAQDEWFRRFAVRVRALVIAKLCDVLSCEPQGENQHEFFSTGSLE